MCRGQLLPQDYDLLDMYAETLIEDQDLVAACNILHSLCLQRPDSSTAHTVPHLSSSGSELP